jgi:predicted Zn-dependent protease with MMP-like domain
LGPTQETGAHRAFAQPGGGLSPRKTAMLKAQRRRFTTAPSLEELEAIAASALETLPGKLRAWIDNVAIRIEEFPDSDVEREMDLESPFDLLGLYQGVDRLHRGLADPPVLPDMIFLYRRPILDYWCEGEEDLTHIVRHVLIHEIGHHFGLSDADMERMEKTLAC